MAEAYRGTQPPYKREETFQTHRISSTLGYECLPVPGRATLAGFQVPEIRKGQARRRVFRHYTLRVFQVPQVGVKEERRVLRHVSDD